MTTNMRSYGKIGNVARMMASTERSGMGLLPDQNSLGTLPAKLRPEDRQRRNLRNHWPDGGAPARIRGTEMNVYEFGIWTATPNVACRSACPRTASVHRQRAHTRLLNCCMLLYLHRSLHCLTAPNAYADQAARRPRPSPAGAFRFSPLDPGRVPLTPRPLSTPLLASFDKSFSACFPSSSPRFSCTGRTLIGSRPSLPISTYSSPVFQS